MDWEGRVRGDPFPMVSCSVPEPLSMSSMYLDTPGTILGCNASASAHTLWRSIPGRHSHSDSPRTIIRHHSHSDNPSTILGVPAHPFGRTLSNAHMTDYPRTSYNSDIPG